MIGSHSIHFSRKDNATRICYDLPFRVHIARVYPLAAPDGTTLIVYGHDRGLSAVWKDGRRSTMRETADPTKTAPIVKAFHLFLDTEVVDLALPDVPPASFWNASSIPTIFSTNIIVAAACADANVRVFTLPLSPQDGEKTLRGVERETATIALSGQPTSVSVTWTPRTPDLLEDLSPDEEEHRPQSSKDFDLLVAAASTETVSYLSIAQIPLIGDTIRPGHHTPFQKRPLQYSPEISFSPAVYPAKQHTQLLVVNRGGSVAVYDPLLRPKDARVPRFDIDVAPLPEKGTWIAAFSAPIDTQKLPDLRFMQRKRILSAQWTSGGKSILALLSDGEWGVWDFDHAAPAGAQSNRRDAFALRGYVGSSGSIPSHDASAPKKPRGTRSSLAPMTPNTRRVKEEALFGGHADSTESSHARGGVTRYMAPSLSGSATDEGVLLWYEQAVYTIPSLQAFWTRAIKDSASRRSDAPGGSLYGPGLSRVEGTEPNGELITSVSALPHVGSESASVAARQDVLVTGEHRLLFVTNTMPRTAEQANAVFQRQLRQKAGQTERDQQLLARGELDLGGVDRMLDSYNMDEDDPFGTPVPRREGPKRVGFME
ncbi:hypothetical protein EJ06DRAFT_557188 [Trichodelitschia bisporula]|uniref:Uncharacterized protein n=1 Tax=Trichodelitschia bisporula TaxID=703511 RepID=A0A6G1HWM2_9PEZI|nr:hypothetical protein EJ06DRAFT_557188 [Trichodelitschia bisporula]